MVSSSAKRISLNTVMDRESRMINSKAQKDRYGSTGCGDSGLHTQCFGPLAADIPLNQSAMHSVCIYAYTHVLHRTGRQRPALAREFDISMCTLQHVHNTFDVLHP